MELDTDTEQVLYLLNYNNKYPISESEILNEVELKTFPLDFIHSAKIISLKSEIRLKIKKIKTTSLTIKIIP